ncbi:eukaryotic translation initiation factor 2-alpha kinase 1-like [Sitodiplosis mosellana]|uniref:eukaryotic translation initiation factor 2-alpha kinase 1-like n=1 Tax=Sitodiplosis mosellana TaxID=263140 RepID=UPI00244522B7|nr:eukaryotic translation initiation factor 2-alpha kinase 1-like [Sitodiplosis mosellana]
MESDEESEQVSDWTHLDSLKTFEWVEHESSPLSNLLHQSPACSMNTDHFDSSTKLVDNTASVRDNFIEQLATKASAPVSLLVESLVQQLCSMIEPDQSNAENLYKTICKQLHRMNLIDETFKMGEFDVMRSQYQRALYQLATVARGTSKIPLNLQSVWPLSDSASMQWSRYHREFEELNFVAGGGFGRVYRARNKLDGIEYAVKKVTIKYRTIKRVLSHLAEVKTFASLNHNNIVPYKAAWLEPLFDDPSNRPRVTDGKHLQKHLANRKRSNGKKASKISSLSKGFEVAIFDVDSKLSATTNNDEEESESETETSESDGETGPDKPIADCRNHLQLPTNNHADESSDFIQFQATHDDVVDGANLSAMESAPDKRLVKPNENHPNNNFIKGNLEFDESQPHLKLKWATLYIQMSFRPLTLRAWLDERNKNSDFNEFYQKFIEKSVRQWDRTIIEDDEDDEVNRNATTGAVTKFKDKTTARWRLSASMSSTSLEKTLAKTWDSLDVTQTIFTQALSGLRYIHLQNIVHHDIKPSNIFIGCEKNGELYVQLGDFGLACPLQAKHSPDSMIGTITYAAPEQLKGHCDPKSDIYSLGIILLELLIPFSTDMERLKTIEAARKGVLPSNIPPKFLNLLKALLQKHTKRPDAVGTFDLLTKLELWNGNSDSIHENTSQRNGDLQSQLTQITDELNQLKMQLASPLANDSLKDIRTNIPNVSVEGGDLATIASSESFSFVSQTAEQTTVFKSFGLDLDEDKDKDRKIQILSNKLIESDKEANELKKEIERLRDIINQRPG